MMKAGFILAILGLIDLVFAEYIEKAITGKSLMEAYWVNASIHHSLLLFGLVITLLGVIMIVLDLNKKHIPS